LSEGDTGILIYSIYLGAIYAMKLSPDLEILATCSNLGSVKLWDTKNWDNLAEIRDQQVSSRYHKWD
jgi:hypothetical protein